MAMLPIAGNVIKAQPKLSIDMGIGFYEPNLVGFDKMRQSSFQQSQFLIEMCF